MRRRESTSKPIQAKGKSLDWFACLLACVPLRVSQRTCHSPRCPASHVPSNSHPLSPHSHSHTTHIHTQFALFSTTHLISNLCPVHLVQLHLSTRSSTPRSIMLNRGIFICAAKRTPFGSFGGTLKDVSDRLLTTLLSSGQKHTNGTHNSGSALPPSPTTCHCPPSVLIPIYVLSGQARTAAPVIGTVIGTVVGRSHRHRDWL